MLGSKQTDLSIDTLLLDPEPPETRSRLIRFPLDWQDNALLPLEDLLEILSVEVADVLPIPEMPSYAIGICNWHGEMLWLIDLNQLVGYPSGPSTPLTVLVVQTSEYTIGAVVSAVNDIELHDLQQLQPPTIGFFGPKLLPLVRGMLPGCSDAVLDLRLIQSLLWKI